MHAAVLGDIQKVTAAATAGSDEPSLRSAVEGDVKTLLSDLTATT